MHKRLGEILLDLGVITEEQLDHSLAKQRETGFRIGEILVEIGATNAHQISKALNYQKQLVAGIAIAAGLGLSLSAAAPQLAVAAESSAPQSLTQLMSDNDPQVLALDYTGNPELTFAITESDVKAGYAVIRNHGDVLWRTNSQRWFVRVEHGDWNTPKPLQLYVKHGGDVDPSDPRWVYLDQGPTPLVEGDQPGEGKLEGIDWMMLLPVTGLQPGTYVVNVSFTIECDTDNPGSW